MVTNCSLEHLFINSRKSILAAFINTHLLESPLGSIHEFEQDRHCFQVPWQGKDPRSPHCNLVWRKINLSNRVFQYVALRRLELNRMSIIADYRSGIFPVAKLYSECMRGMKWS
jgi:hypothetical protein